MRIRKHLRSPAFVSTRSDPPAAPAFETSFHNALISNTLCVKLFTESGNPTPSIVMRNLPSSNHIATNIAGLTKVNDKDSDSVELMQTPIANKEEEIEKPRVCTLNKSPWDDPAFVQGFFTKPTIEPADEESMQNCRRTIKKRRRSNLASDTKAIAEAKQQPKVHVEDEENDFNKTDISRHGRNRRAEMKKNGHGKEVLNVPEAEELLESAPTNIKTNAIAYGKEVLQVAENKEQVLESALRRVFSEKVSLTVREAGCKLNTLGNANNIISEGLPLSVQVRRTLLNSPYFVKMDDGKFALWDNFPNSKVGRQDEEKISSSKIEKRMRIHKFDGDEDCATYKEPAKELVQSETKQEHGLLKTILTKGKRSRRAYETARGERRD